MVESKSDEPEVENNDIADLVGQMKKQLIKSAIENRRRNHKLRKEKNVAKPPTFTRSHYHSAVSQSSDGAGYETP